MSAQTLSTQLMLIINSFELRFQNQRQVEQPTARAPLTRAELDLDLEIDAIVAELRRHCFTGVDGFPNWLSTGLPDPNGRLAYEPLDAGLYGGTMGVLLFLEARARLDGDPWCRDIAAQLQVAQTNRFRSESAAAQFAAFFGIGAGYGCGSALYGLAFLASLEQSKNLLQSGANICSALNNEDWSRHSLDIISGVSGAILGLLAFAEVAPRSAALDLAVRAGKHVSEKVLAVLQRTTDDTAPISSGTAHGACGLLLALERLVACTGAALPREAASTLSDSLMSRSHPIVYFDKRHGGHSRHENLSWCWGLAGELCLTPEHGQEDILRSAISRLGTRLAAGFPNEAMDGMPVDHLCCGTAGLIQALSNLRITGREGFSRTSRKLATLMVDRARINQGFRFYASLEPAIFNASLFRGLSGVGYVLLALKYPGRLPSIIRFEVTP